MRWHIAVAVVLQPIRVLSLQELVGHLAVVCQVQVAHQGRMASAAGLTLAPFPTVLVKLQDCQIQEHQLQPVLVVPNQVVKPNQQATKM